MGGEKARSHLFFPYVFRSCLQKPTQMDHRPQSYKKMEQMPIFPPIYYYKVTLSTSSRKQIDDDVYKETFVSLIVVLFFTTTSRVIIRRNMLHIF
uniref:Uncharacterized protein n=1 Tax=Arundo donax TaxID=35708 RepID=A0A0A9GGK5_ARUDO